MCRSTPTGGRLPAPLRCGRQNTPHWHADTNWGSYRVTGSTPVRVCETISLIIASGQRWPTSTTKSEMTARLTPTSSRVSSPGSLTKLEQVASHTALLGYALVSTPPSWHKGNKTPGDQVRSSAHQHVDVAANTWCSCQPGVGGDERAREAFGERYVGGIVGGHVRAEFVGADHQWACREAGDR